MELKDELILALHNLVKLKEHKDENGKDEFYLKHQPHVWEYAKHVLKLCEGKETPDESSGLIKPDVIKSVCHECDELPAIMDSDGIFKKQHCQRHTVL